LDQFIFLQFEPKKKKKLKTKKQLDSQRKDAKSSHNIETGAEKLHRGTLGSGHIHCKEMVPPKVMILKMVSLDFMVAHLTDCLFSCNEVNRGVPKWENL
jgi:hypothetical protein